jgi:hypothetical protein
LLYAIVQSNFLALIVQIAIAGIENDLSGSFHMAAAVIVILGLTAVLNDS